MSKGMLDLELGWGSALVATAAALSVVLTGFIMKLLQARAVKQTQDKRERDDTIAEWANLFETTTKRLQEDIDDGKKENKSMREQMHKLRDKHHEDMLRVTVEAAQCKMENAELRGEIKLLQASMHRLQVAVGDTAPGTSMPCLVIAETDGTIVECSPAVAPVLEWLPTELIGKSLEMIVPEDLRERHREALQNIDFSGTAPWTERTVLTEALTKSGRRVKVSVRVKGWQTGGHWLLSGEIQERVSQ